MPTKNNISNPTETIKENLDKGVKWMQGANQKFVEAQKEQIKQATDMFNNKSFDNNLNSFNKFDNPFSDSIKGLS